MMVERLLRVLVALAAVGVATPAAEWYGEDTWVVVVGASRYFANYRHAANALAMRRVARQLGVPRERILVLLAEDPSYDARNPRRGEVYIGANGERTPEKNLLLDGDGLGGPSSDADYAGDVVTPALVRALLTGRVHPATPLGKRLRSTTASNVLLYLTGHGGDGFLKFHDSDELAAVELADAVAEMHAKGRYKRLVIVIDTCQAASMLAELDADRTPGVLGVASARLGENAYAANADKDIGVALADRFTEYVARYFDKEGADGTWGDFEAALRRAPTRSNLVVHDAAWASPDWRDAPLRAFFGSPPAARVVPWP